ncbi:unnamed protein product [Dibothriocephalus latus]|uniref:Calpain catalytic domain-containing protein n=1 Tax=Dibothriocephalus latus TaxID=60516 RepID=A0A3P6TIM4_DIBLA|nr:unnamed protein product [Dibothriocephalus latus]
MIYMPVDIGRARVSSFGEFSRLSRVSLGDHLGVIPIEAVNTIKGVRKHELNGSYEALNVGLIGDAMDDIVGGLTESYCLAPGEDQGMRPPPEIDDILIKAFDRRSLITARIKTEAMLLRRKAAKASVLNVSVAHRTGLGTLFDVIYLLQSADTSGALMLASCSIALQLHGVVFSHMELGMSTRLERE